MKFFSLHTGIRPSESLKHYGDEKRLEKNFQRLYNFKFTCCTHTERQRIVKKPYITGLDIQLHAMNSFHI